MLQILTCSATWASRYVLDLKRNVGLEYIFHLQGNLADTNLVSGDGTPVNCHTVMLAGLSPFLRQVMASSKGDQVILADFTTSAVCSLLNLLYTGVYVLKLRILLYTCQKVRTLRKYLRSKSGQAQM